MEIKQRNSINDSLRKYDYMSNDDTDFIEITEWSNEEGYDITIETKKGSKSISLTHGELDAINYLKMSLEYADRK